jgi:hypothetical protein
MALFALQAPDKKHKTKVIKNINKITKITKTLLK